MIHIATIAAYQIDEDVGGGFRGVYFDRVTYTRFASERLESLEAAKFWAKSEAARRHAAGGYTLAALRRNGEYRANVWSV